ncbi:NPCBM/NEW2 domain-containing protein, partial [Massilia timonae]
DPWSNTRSGGSRPQYAGWGGAQADTTPYGQSLQVAGQVFESGLGVLSNSRLQVKNDGGHAQLTASVGVDDSTENTRQPVRFYVYGDGKLLAESAPVAFGARAPLLQADVRGVRLIELVVRGSQAADAPPVVATWGDARLTHAAGSPATVQRR